MSSFLGREEQKMGDWRPPEPLPELGPPGPADIFAPGLLGPALLEPKPIAGAWDCIRPSCSVLTVDGSSWDLRESRSKVMVLLLGSSSPWQYCSYP